MRVMRSLVLAASLSVGLSFGLTAGAAAPMADGRAGKSDVSGYLGFSRGGATVGGAYEYLYDGAQGIGGQLHIYPKNTDVKHAANGLVIVGAFTAYHFYKGTWDFSLAPGLNIINLSAIAPAKDETDLGPSVQISLTQALNERVSLGFDFANYWVWFGDARGGAMSDLDFKVKVGF